MFRSVLGQATPSSIFDRGEIHISQDGRRMYEFSSSRSLSEAALGVDFPRVEGPVELNHFTSFAGFQGIVASRQLYLASLAKRLHEDEFTTFMDEHGLAGYRDLNEGGRQVYEELADDLFFCSLTRPGNPDEDQLWQNFGEKERGVRLALRLTPAPAADLREMAYRRAGHNTALKRINEGLRAEGLVYTPWTVSRICAFFLTLGYEDEREVRLIIKRHQGGPNPAIHFQGHEVWPVAVGAAGRKTDDPWCQVELISVTPGRARPAADVHAALASTAYAAVPVL